MSRNILLIEPNYKNKYPPIGLMKIATYHRNLGDKVTFFKGDLKELLANLLTKMCINKLDKIDKTVNWNAHYENIKQYLKNRNSSNYYELSVTKSKYHPLVEEAIIEQRKNLLSKTYEKKPLFNRVYVTTLFTFYWDITIKTINFAKTLVKNDTDVFVGGIAATLLYDDIVKQTGIKPIKGLLNKPKLLDKNNNTIIDTLPLDYSILDETDYKYSESNAYYGYMTRGCIRKCQFCAVPILEPNYCEFISMKQNIKRIKTIYGEKRNLLLLDNNVLASPRFSEIIQEIIDCGFGKNATYIEPNEYEIAMKNLKNGLNNTAYIRKIFNINLQLLNRLRGETEQRVYNLLEANQLLNIHTTTKMKLLKIATEILPLYTKYFRKIPRQRYIDFNQGVDARLINKEKAELLGKINIRPLRIAFDNINDRKCYENAVRLSAKAGIRNFSNYLLYNFNDKPIELYQRLKINIDLCEELGINIYSFPMKFHPIVGDDRFNRDYLGKYWNRKFIRAIQAILNSTKGKIGRDSDKKDSFFEKAFGKSEDEFSSILEMPETFILYRLFFEWLGDEKNYPVSTNAWRQCWQKTFEKLNKEEIAELKNIIHENNFSSIPKKYSNPMFSKLLSFYVNYRDDINNPASKLYKLKQEYDKNPTRKTRRKHLKL
jgi:hypothetical protein